MVILSRLSNFTVSHIRLLHFLNAVPEANTAKVASEGELLGLFDKTYHCDVEETVLSDLVSWRLLESRYEDLKNEVYVITDQIFGTSYDDDNGLPCRRFTSDFGRKLVKFISER